MDRPGDPLGSRALGALVTRCARQNILSVAEAHRQATSSRTSATGRIVSEFLMIIRVLRLIAARYCNFNFWCLAEDSNLDEPDSESGAFANFASEAMLLVDRARFELALSPGTRFYRPLPNHSATDPAFCLNTRRMRKQKARIPCGDPGSACAACLLEAELHLQLLPDLPYCRIPLLSQIRFNPRHVT